MLGAGDEVLSAAMRLYEEEQDREDFVDTVHRILARRSCQTPKAKPARAARLLHLIRVLVDIGALLQEDIFALAYLIATNDPQLNAVPEVTRRETAESLAVHLRVLGRILEQWKQATFLGVSYSVICDLAASGAFSPEHTAYLQILCLSGDETLQAIISVYLDDPNRDELLESIDHLLALSESAEGFDEMSADDVYAMFIRSTGPHAPMFPLDGSDASPAVAPALGSLFAAQSLNVDLSRLGGFVDPLSVYLAAYQENGLITPLDRMLLQHLYNANHPSMREALALYQRYPGRPEADALLWNALQRLLSANRPVDFWSNRVISVLYQHKVLSVTERDHCLRLVEAQDERILACLGTSEDPFLDEERLAALMHLAQEWRASVSNPPALIILDELRSMGRLSHEDADILVNRLYWSDPDVQAAFDQLESDELEVGWPAFCLQLDQIVRAEPSKKFDFYRQQGEEYLETLLKQGGLGTVQYHSLADLLQQEDPTLMAIFAEYDDTQDADELYDSVARLSMRWKRRSPHQNLLALLAYLEDSEYIAPHAAEALLSRAYHEDEVLLAAYSLFENSPADHVEAAWHDLWDSLARMVCKDLGVGPDEVTGKASGSAPADFAQAQATAKKPTTVYPGFDDPFFHGDVDNEDVQTVEYDQHHHALPAGMTLPQAMAEAAARDRTLYQAHHVEMQSMEDEAFEAHVQRLVEWYRHAGRIAGLAESSAFLRFVSASPGHALHDVLLAAVAEYSSKPSTKASIELFDTLNVIGSRWERESSPLQQSLIAMIEQLVNHKQLLREEADLLLGLSMESDHGLLESFSQFLSSRSSPIQARRQLLKDLHRALEKELGQDAQALRLDAHRLLDLLENAGTVGPAGIAYLRQLWQQEDEVLLAIFATFEETGDASDALDSLSHLAGRWKRQADLPTIDLLRLMDMILADGILSAPVASTLEYLVFSQEPTLWAAYYNYAETDFSKPAWLEFWDTVRHIVWRYHPNTQEFTTPIEKLTRQLGKCIDGLFYGQVERVLSATGHRYLLDLLSQGDVVLEAAFMRYRDTGDFDDFADTLLRLAQRWTRTSPHQELLAHLDFLYTGGHVVFAEYDLLQGLVYSHRPEILSLWTELLERLRRGYQKNEALGHLYGQLCKLLDGQVDQVANRVSETASKFVAGLASRSDFGLSPAGFIYLQHLVDVQDETLLAIFAEYSQDPTELADSLLRLAQRWRRLSPFQGLLSVIDSWTSQRLLSAEQSAEAEKLVLYRDQDLVSAYQAYVQHRDSSKLFVSLMRVLRQQLTASFDHYAEQAARVVRVLEAQGELNSADAAYLRSCAEAFDPALMAAFAEYDDGGAVDELLDTIARVASRWRKQNPLVSYVSHLLDYIERQHFLSEPVLDILRLRLLKGDTVLMAAASIYEEDGDWSEFLDTLLRIAVDVIRAGSMQEHLVAAVSELRASELLTAAEVAYLQQLIEEDNSAVLQAYGDYESSADYQELLTALSKLATCWERELRHQERRVLRLIGDLVGSGVFTEHGRDALELHLLARDPVILAAFAVYEESDRSGKQLKELVDTWQRKLNSQTRRAENPVDDAEYEDEHLRGLCQDGLLSERERDYLRQLFGTHEGLKQSVRQAADV